MKKIVLILGIFFCCFNNLLAQKTTSDTITVHIEDADYMRGFSDSLRLLVGDVFLSQLDEQLIFLCDSASIFDEGKSFNAYRNVQLQQSDSINIYADIMKYRTTERKAYLYKNVHLSDGTADIFADTLIYDTQTRQALLLPRVTINADSTTIVADSIYYNTRNKQAELFGNVTLQSGDMNISSNEMDYNMNTEIGHYKNGGKLVNEDAVLTSKNGTFRGKKNEVQFDEQVVYKDSTYVLNTASLLYNIKTEKAIFEGKSTVTNEGNTIDCERGTYDAKTKQVAVESNAIIRQENNTLQADSLSFDNETGKGYAVGNVFWEDTIQQISIQGDYIEFEDSSNYVLASNRPLMTQIIENNDKNDTLYMMADTLLTQEIADSVRQFEATDKVMVYKSDFQAVSEYMTYNEQDSIFYFYGNPILWFEQTQLYADTIIFETRNNDPYKFSLLGNAFMGTEVQEGVYDQIAGDQIYGRFIEGELKKIDVFTKAKSIYFVRDDADESYIGVNQSSAEDMYIKVDSNTVQQINYVQKAKAKFLKMEQVDPFSLKLNGFVWKTEKRPNSVSDLLDSRNTENEEDDEILDNKKPNSQGNKDSLALKNFLAKADSLAQIPQEENELTRIRESKKNRKPKDENKPETDKSKPPKAKKASDTENPKKETKTATIIKGERQSEVIILEAE